MVKAAQHCRALEKEDSNDEGNCYRVSEVAADESGEGLSVLRSSRAADGDHEPDEVPYLKENANDDC